MAKKRPAACHKAVKKAAADQNVIAPDYYATFQCIGGDCEDNCCSAGWRIDIDRATWQRYQSCPSETFAQLLREAIQLETRPDLKSHDRYATLKLRPDLSCPFLMDDKLCMIHKEMGFEALSNTCASYPRVVNRAGDYFEYGLAVSCPEAARVVLLHETPTKLVTCPADPTLTGRDLTASSLSIKPNEVQVVNQLRVLILRILQWRELSLGARMLLLGSLLDEVSRMRGSARSKDMNVIMPALEAYAALFADPAYVEAEYTLLPGNLPRKLQYTTGFLADFLTSVHPRFKECITAFADGLLGGLSCDTPGDANEMLARYQKFYDDYYAPYFREKSYILENYLVNEVLIKVFPFGPGGGLDKYRAMVFNLAIIQVMLVGIAGHYRGLTDVHVIQFIQTFTRRSTHNPKYLGKLTEALASKDAPSCVEVMWMLKER